MPPAASGPDASAVAGNAPASQAPPAATPNAPAPAPATPPMQAPPLTTPAPSGPASGTAVLHGHISDPTGALIPGAQITVSIAANGKQVGPAISADGAGAYSMRGLSAGSYVIQANFQGFAPFVSKPIQLGSGQSKNVDIQMAIEAADVQVVVTDEGGPTVSTDAGANASAIVLKGSDLDALSDDPDELSNELTALAGPSAGPNGGQIYIDGFTGGTLPPKSAIREIRINQNPFSAEYDKLGYGRIEILTKPGTDTLHGRVFGQGNDNVFNTGNPFTTELPSYYSYQYNGTVSGAMSKWASFFVSVEQRNNQQDSVYTILNGPQCAVAVAPTAVCPSTYLPSTGSVSGSLFSPGTRISVSPRIDLQLGQKDTVTMRYQFTHNKVTDSLGGSTSLPSLANNTDTNEHDIQISDSHIVSDKMVNETRFEYRRGASDETPDTTTVWFGVPGAFSGGGDLDQLIDTHSDHLELQNYTTMTQGRQAIKFGAWLRDNRQATTTNSGFNGSFRFPSVAAFIDTWNGVVGGDSFATIAAKCPSTQTGGCLPTNLSYTTGNLAFQGNVFDGSLFVQDDWKVNKFLTLSGGLRWETQNHTADHNDWAPRVAFAYALDGHQKNGVAKTVLRGGFGFFYDRFAIANLMNLEMFNGGANSQKQISIANPSCAAPTATAGNPPSTLNDIDFSACGVGTTQTPVIDQISSSYRAPYAEQAGASLERQVTKAATVTLTYLHSFGVHQLVTRNSNAYEPGTFQYGSATLTGVRRNPSLGIVDQYFPEAVYNQNQVIVNINARFSPKLGVQGFYNWTEGNSDGGGGSNPTNSYNLWQDYGRAGFIHPQMLFLMGNYTGPWAIAFNPFLVFQAGRPFNLTTPYDLTGDAFFNDRPYQATSTSPCETGQPQYVQNSFGCLDTIPGPDEAIVAPNLGNSPSSFVLNLRVSRSWGIGPKVESSASNQPQGGPPPGAPPGGGGGGRGGGGGPGGGPGGGFGPGGFGGGGMRGLSIGGMGGTGRKYSLNFSVNALNVFNDINLGTPVGQITAKSFDQSTSLAGGMFASPGSTASRRIYLMAAFQF